MVARLKNFFKEYLATAMLNVLIVSIILLLVFKIWWAAALVGLFLIAYIVLPRFK